VRSELLTEAHVGSDPNEAHIHGGVCPTTDGTVLLVGATDIHTGFFLVLGLGVDGWS
jgi:hypothetical protein